jgi:LmbE family N-acetylglucosaminyl deacetylase
MELANPSAEIFVPDGTDIEYALSRTTHMAIAAHHDDLEVMAVHGILRCFGNEEEWFFGVIVTDGSGSPRSGAYAEVSDDEMRQVRREEQRTAASIGEYGGVALLDYPSPVVKDPSAADATNDIARLVSATRPQVVYTHNLFDSHDTHVAVTLRVISALRALPEPHRPGTAYGCEVWRDLDWLPNPDKIVLDVSERPDLQAALLEVFDSQIAGGKRYDLATLGRRRANATFYSSHQVDEVEMATFAADLGPLIDDPSLDPEEFVRGRLNRFSDDVLDRIRRISGES